MQANESHENISKISSVQPVELIFDKISVFVESNVEAKDDERMGWTNMKGSRNILKECSGKFAPSTFTTIVGPSGCGKTTMLNLLSGRIHSQKITSYGNLFINGNHVKNISKFKNLIGYVMQDDLMLPTFTPRQTFKFVADLRLGNKTEEQKDEVVNELLNALGLRKCADTYVGNNWIRGISGGERKRTSIGMQLLVNPSLIFLDEPTTGLDSTTALNLIRLLKNFANNGRTIISTIHQPSSQIFQEFQRLMLMVDGNVIYNGDSASSIQYFGRINMGVPVHTNPIDHYMKMMNKQSIIFKYIESGEEYTEEKIQQQFQQRVLFLINHFKKNQEKVQVEVKETEIKKVESASWGSQFCRITERTFKNEYRDPVALKAKVLQIVFYAILSLIFFERIATNKNSFVQNFKGLIFYLGISVSFPATFGTLEVFNGERSVFIRERQSNTYSTSSYFFARTIASIPQEFILPLIFILITYFVIHLNETSGSFFFSYLTLLLMSWMGSGYGLFISSLFQDLQVAMAMVPITLAPILLVAGYLAPLSEVHDFYKVIEYLSLYKYGYQAMAYSQFYDGLNVTGTYDGQQYTYEFPYEEYDSIFSFQDPFWVNFMMMAILGVILRLLALLVMYIIGRSTNADLLPVEENKLITERNNQKIN